MESLKSILWKCGTLSLVFGIWKNLKVLYTDRSYFFQRIKSISVELEYWFISLKPKYAPLGKLVSVLKPPKLYHSCQKNFVEQSLCRILIPWHFPNTSIILSFKTQGLELRFFGLKNCLVELYRDCFNYALWARKTVKCFSVVNGRK